MSETSVLEPTKSAGRFVRARRHVATAMKGFVWGALVGLAIWRLGVFPLGLELLPIVGVVGLVLRFTRWWPVLGITGGLIICLLLMIGYSPLMPGLATRLERHDPPQKREAVVVLGSFAFADGVLSDQAEARALKGFAILRSHYASRLILTCPPPPNVPWDELITRQMQELGVEAPVDVVGPARNTHEEAVQVARLARKNGWNSVILVTHPWHMRRAAACFEREGLKVICAPCEEDRYDWGHLNDESDRVRCFQDWLHEVVGFAVYRWRGWV